MHQQLDETVIAVPALRPYAGLIGTAFDGLAKHDEPMPGEVLYEARNRPTWPHIPLGSLHYFTI